MIRSVAATRQMLARVLRQWADWVSAEPYASARRHPECNEESDESAQALEHNQLQGPFAPRGTRPRSRMSSTPPQHWAELVRHAAPDLLSPREFPGDGQQSSGLTSEVEPVRVEPALPAEAGEPVSVNQDASPQMPLRPPVGRLQYASEREPASLSRAAVTPDARSSMQPILPPRRRVPDVVEALPKAAALRQRPPQDFEGLRSDTQSHARPFAGPAAPGPKPERRRSQVSAPPQPLNARQVTHPDDSLASPQQKKGKTVDALEASAPKTGAPTLSTNDEAEVPAHVRDVELPRSFASVMVAPANPATSSGGRSKDVSTCAGETPLSMWPQNYVERDEEHAVHGDPRWPELLEEQTIVSEECATALDRWKRTARLIHEQRGED